MSQLPEFLLPQNNQAPTKPSPKAGLSEYLRERFLANTQSLNAVDTPKVLVQYLNGHPDKPLYEQSGEHANEQTLWLDLELDPKSKDKPRLIEGAFVVDNYYWQFDASQFFQYTDDVIELLNTAHFLGGHNIIEFDLPKLHQLLSNTSSSYLENQSNQHPQSFSLESWQQKAWDTLILSCLFIPHQPSHALAKLYKANVNHNDPVQDCLESREVLRLCKQAWQTLPSDWQLLFYRVLPQLRALSVHAEHIGLSDCFAIDANNIFDIDTVFNALPEGNQSKLKALLQTYSANTNTQSTPSGQTQLWQNLGVATFISWLRFYDKPQARRPVWISKHPLYQLGFNQAEQAYFELDDVSDTWINAQAKRFFGFDTLRDGQMQIVKAVLSNKDIPLGILPTGGGKSLTFQLPALILSHYQRGLTVVISPLKALIEDQVIDLHSKIPDFESRIAYLTSGQTPEVQQEVMTGIWQGDIDIIYLSPERLRTHSIRKLLQNRPPAFWVLDEAHTLSQWGTDFRPDFLRIADHIKACYQALPFADKHNSTAQGRAKQDNLNQTAFDFADALDESHQQARQQTHQQSTDVSNISQVNPPRISLVTATASQRVKSDLQTELTDKLGALTDAKPLVQYGVSLEDLKIWREDITAYVLTVIKDHRKSKALEIVEARMKWYARTYPEHPQQAVAIVYLRSRQGCEEYAEDFAKRGLKAVAYHSKLDDSQKKDVLSKFKNDELDVVVCTNAFGMGIDKEGIHTVIHSGPPNNIESYIQEIGRVARKSYEVGEAYLLWSEEDISKMFKHERDSRIPNTNTLKQCWQTISPTLKRPQDDRWFPSSLLSPVLDANYDAEQLNTQIRVALLALERYGLLEEKDQQPAWVSIRLLDNPPANPHSSLAKLYAQLRQISSHVVSQNDAKDTTQNSAENDAQSQTEQTHVDKPDTGKNGLDTSDDIDKAVNRYHLPELAVVLGYSVKQLLKLLRELVKNGHAQWQVVVRIRTKYTHQYLKGEFNRLSRIMSALQEGVSQAVGFDDAVISDELETQGYTTLNTKALDNWLSQHKHSFNSKNHILPTFRRLGILKVRTQNKRVQLSPTEMTKTWLYDNDKPDGWQSWIALANSIIGQLDILFIETLLPKMPDQKDGESKKFNLDKLATQVASTPDDVLSQLETLGRLELLELSRLDDSKDAIFFIGENRHSERRSNYNEVAYRYLKQHYEDRCQRIHVLHAWLTAEPEVRETMVEDYFKKPLADIIDTYIIGNDTFADVDTNEPYLKDYSKVVLPSYFSPVQRQIVEDTSRASLVLAGPGSGKTTVVVHRVAYLLMIEHIKPEKILILAYNRLAVSELRQRLQALVGVHAIGVTIQTFHELARQIIGMSEKEAPEPALHDIVRRIPHLQADYKRAEKSWSPDTKNKVLDNARYQWLIDEAIRHLQERPQHFQYIMVDEFQDIDASQYELIGLLADLQAVEDDEGNNEDDKDSNEAIADEQGADNKNNDKQNDSKQDGRTKDKFDQRSHLMVVGDDDQNLYAFRGASIEFIQKFTQNYHIGKQQAFYLLDNYRSASNIVELANKFIELALPVDARLKSDKYRVQPTNAHPSEPIRHAFYQQTQGVDMASWLAEDIKQRLTDRHNQTESVNSVNIDKPNKENTAPTIVVLAPQWQYFDAVQHYLEQAGITSGRYHESEQVKPLNSLIGQALYDYLTEDRLKQIEGDVVTALDSWRKEAKLNHLDMAWTAICERLAGLQDMTHEALLPILESVSYQPTADVMLITYHSAKGMEFDHVYVIDKQSNPSNQTVDDKQDNDRPLYVALTRAKRTLTLLQHRKQHHNVLAELASQYCQAVTVPQTTVPDKLTFHRLLHLEEMVLTPKQLVSDKGRAFIKDTFCHNKWSEHRTPESINNVFKPYKYNPPARLADGFYSKQDRVLVQFSREFNKQFTQQDYDNGLLQMVGFTTTLFYQNDTSYYEKAGYTGDATSHYLIVPYVRFGVSVK